MSSPTYQFHLDKIHEIIGWFCSSKMRQQKWVQKSHLEVCWRSNQQTSEVITNQGAKRRLGWTLAPAGGDGGDTLCLTSQSRLFAVLLASSPSPAEAVPNTWLPSTVWTMAWRMAKLLYYLLSTDAWAVKDIPRPNMLGRTNLYWGWDPDAVVAHDENFWWVNLWWVLLWCDPFDDHLVLFLVDISKTIAKELRHSSADQDIEFEMGVGVSKGRLRYVEITRATMDPTGVIMVILWTLVTGSSDMVEI